MSPRPMLKSIWTKMPKIPKGVCAGARTSGRACHRRRNKMVCLPCRQLKHTMESQTPTLVWSSHLKNSDLNSMPVPFRCLLFSMACYLWLGFPYQPLPLFCQPGTAPLSNITHTAPSPIPPNFCQRSAGCPWVARESQACSGLSSVPLSLSPSGCAHWSISISHGAFSAEPAGSSHQRAWEGGGKPPLGQCHSSWTGLSVCHY